MMRQNAGFAIAMVFLMSALGGCVAPPDGVAAGDIATDVASLLPVDASGLVPKLFDGYVHSFVDFKSQMGDTIHADLYVPDHSKLKEEYASTPLFATRGHDGELSLKHPVVIFASPYHDSKNSSDPERKRASTFDRWIMDQLVPRGYAFATVELPGTAGSGGCWDFMGPHEQAAMYDAVEYFGTQDWSNGKVGMIGVSYDGMTQIMAMAKKPPHLAAVVPIAALTSAYHGIYMNGVPYAGFWPTAIIAYNVLIGMDTSPIDGVPPNPSDPRPPVLQDEIVQGWAEHMAGNPQCLPENMKEGNLNGGDFNAYYEARDFRPTAAEITVPTFQTQGFLDANVRADNAFPWVNDLVGPKTVWLGQWYHSSANMSNSGRDDMFLRVHQFWDRYLYGVENGYETDNLGFFVQDSEGRWRHEDAWPPQDAAKVEFHLSPGRLGSVSEGAAESVLDDDRRSFATANLEQPNVLVYESEALGADLHIAGLAKLALTVSTDAEGDNIIAGLVDCGPSPEDVTKEKCVLITRGAQNLRHREGIDKPMEVEADTPYSIDFHFQPRDYVVKAGHRLALMVSGSDVSWFFTELDLVSTGSAADMALYTAFDVAAASTLTLYHDADRPAVLTLPTVMRTDADVLFVACGLPMKDKPCYVKDKKDIKEY